MIARFTQKTIKRCIILAVATSIIIPSGFVAIKKVTSIYSNYTKFFFTPKSVICIIDDIYSNTLKNSIQNYVYKKCSDLPWHNKPQDLFHDLKNTFPVIHSVTCNFSIDKSLHIIITGLKPCCMINDDYILTDDNKLFSRSLFCDINTSAVYNITINPLLCRNRLPEEVFTLIKKIEPKQWASFAITIHNVNSIELLPYKALCKCRIITDNKNFFNNDKILAIDYVFNDLCEKGSITKKTLQYPNISLAFDIRFKNQVVVKFYKTWRRGRGL